MDPLSRLFGSAARLKLLRLFLFNKEESFSVAEAALRAKVEPDAARSEVLNFLAMRLVKKAGTTYRVNQRFEYLDALDIFIRTTTAVQPDLLLETFKKTGTIRCLVLSGIFTGATEAQLDLLVVGDKLDERAVARTVTVLEAELGREIRYGAFATEDFRYRLGIYDRLVRDIFDYPHRILLDKIGL